MSTPSIAATVRQRIDSQKSFQDSLWRTVVERDKQYREALGLSNEDVNFLTWQDATDFIPPIEVEGKKFVFAVETIYGVIYGGESQDLVMVYPVDSAMEYAAECLSAGKATTLITAVDSDWHEAILVKLQAA